MRLRCYAFALLALVVFCVNRVSAQTGEIKGRVTEKGGNEGVPFAGVAAFQDGQQVIANTADIDGYFTLKPLTPGKYSVRVTSVGYSPAEMAGVIVKVDNTSTVNFELDKGVTMKEVIVSDWAVPLIDVGTPAVQKTVTYDEIQAAPLRDVNSIASTAAGVAQEDAGGELNMRGSRSDATAYYVDGIKVRSFDAGSRGGASGVANKGAEQITVITGGIPAQYGDATGGVISITTRGPSRTWSGGVEVASSKLFDPYNSNLLSFALSGPLLTKGDSMSRTGKSAIGFFLAGDGYYNGDPEPSAVGSYQVPDDKFNDLKQNPLVKNADGSFQYRPYYYTMDSLEPIKARNNVASKGFTLNGKIDFRLLDNLDLTLGGSYAYSNSRNFIDLYSLFNYDNYNNQIDNIWRGYLKITQRFGNAKEDSKSASNIKNAFYTVQADYSRNNRVIQNDAHKDNIWDYGYVGQFTTHRAPLYFTESGDVRLDDGSILHGDSLRILNFYVDTQFSYAPSPLNPNTSAYTTQYYDFTKNDRDGNWNNWFQVVQGGGLLNGDNRIPLNAYGIWATPGRIQNFYQKQELNQFSLKATASADIKNHNLMVGFEYEQRIDREYHVFANSLWDAARLMGNQSGNLDTNGYMSVGNGQNLFIDGVLRPATSTDTLIFYKNQYIPTTNIDGQVAPGFYENLRRRLGVDNTEWVDMDHLNPDFYRNTVDLWTPDEFLTLNMGGYYGYDYLGKKISGSTSLSDYYTRKDANLNYTRNWGAFQPIYMAGYIQDRFQFNDITFNIGLRVDRFDANQPAMKDKYLLYPAYDAGSGPARNLAASMNDYTVPGNIGSDYVVYVNDLHNPTKIVGYRNGDDWYDAGGNHTTDLKESGLLNTSSGSVQPYVQPSAGGVFLRDSSRVDVNAFKDYDPQTTFMPRIAFSFPISDEANFKAHYDILTQRPQDNFLVRFDPVNYNLMARGVSIAASNPNLKPERTTDYEIEFQQRLTRSSAFSISAFYRELHDMIQITNLVYAYPVQYFTYGNVDFGTVKGLTLNYDLRRTGNVRLNAAYTLQFANGTGSSTTGNFNVISAQGQANFRQVTPLSFDQRHNIVTSVDYHYGSGKDYNGPVIKNSQVLSNAGLNLVFRASSGRPFTRQTKATPTADQYSVSRSSLAGSINGSTRPWNFRVDARFDKTFNIKSGSGEKRRNLSLNVYLVMENVFDSRNVIAVYSATGSPTDDGYLASPEGQKAIATAVSPQAYEDLYNVAQSTYNTTAGSRIYSIPRRTRLGIQFNF